jgi:hypothetical protein
MSSLESDAKAFVAPIILSTTLFIPLSPKDQTKIAAWLSKIAILTQYVFVAPLHPQPNDLKHLDERREPSPDFHVWLAAYRRDSDVSSFWDGHGREFIPPGERMTKLNHGVSLSGEAGSFSRANFCAEGRT